MSQEFHKQYEAEYDREAREIDLWSKLSRRQWNDILPWLQVHGSRGEYDDTAYDLEVYADMDLLKILGKLFVFHELLVRSKRYLISSGVLSSSVQLMGYYDFVRVVFVNHEWYYQPSGFPSIQSELDRYVGLGFDHDSLIHLAFLQGVSGLT